MVFSSLPFVCVFLPVVVGLYFALPKAANNFILVVASYAFYGWGDPVALLLLMPSVAVNFQFGRFIDRAMAASRHQLIAAMVALNLLVLIVFKYSDFILANANFLLDKVGLYQVPLPHLTLPLGLSFFTFHIISYLVDVYRGNQRAQQSPLAFALYIINFPQLIAGPIIRYSQIADQLVKRKATLDDVDAGIIRFSTGLAKKLFLANPIGVVADQIFALPGSNLSVPAVWLGAVSYALQIYFDFSGYSDMAIGIARMFGFRFPENFNYPYSAISIQDFWRRWHMTLSAWFRDYVYIPLGGNRIGPWKTAFLPCWSLLLDRMGCAQSADTSIGRGGSNRQTLSGNWRTGWPEEAAAIVFYFLRQPIRRRGRSRWCTPKASACPLWSRTLKQGAVSSMVHGGGKRRGVIHLPR